MPALSPSALNKGQIDDAACYFSAFSIEGELIACLDALIDQDKANRAL